MEPERAREELNIALDTRKQLRNLQRVVASLCDDVQGLKKRKNASDKLIAERLNVINGQLVDLCSSHDMHRTERVWAAQVPPLGRSASISGSFIQRWKSESDLSSRLPSVIRPIGVMKVPLQAPHGLMGPPVPVPSTVTFDNRRTLKEMLKINGRVRRREMSVILGRWRSNAGREGSTEILMTKVSKFLRELLRSLEHGSRFLDGPEELLAKARKLLDTPRHDLMELTTTQAFDAVMDAIPEEEWLSFARNELGISESDIIDVKSTCPPTPEQQHQMDLASDAWNRANGKMD